MSSKVLTSTEKNRTKRVYEACKGNVTEAARVLKLKRTTVRDRLLDMGILKPAVTPRLKLQKVFAQAASTRVVIMTAAQDDTSMYPGFDNLRAYAAHREAEVFVGGFTYNKSLYSDHATRSAYFHADVAPLLRPEIVQLAPRLVWYGDFNCLPTASDPLAGWDTNTRDAWAVFPHAKVALKSIPVVNSRPGKQIMTTGVVTKQNYVAKNAGQKAEFHHTHGATIAEIRPDGKFFLRQLTMNPDGSFQDLDKLVKGGKVVDGPPVEAITWGDCHIEEMEPECAMTAWGYDLDSKRVVAGSSMLDDLRARHQFYHDSFDFKARSPWTRRDAHERHMRIVEGCDSVSGMLDQSARFLDLTRRAWCKSVHVASNHNLYFEKWLKDTDAAADAVNAELWHETNAAYHRAIRSGDTSFSPHAWALQHRAHDLSAIEFLSEGQTFRICQTTQPIECGLHGHWGPRGAKGSAASLSKIVERVNAGHIHEPRILEGAYFAGTFSRKNVRYATKAPGAWHHAVIVTYATGKRTIVTFEDGAYRA